MAMTRSPLRRGSFRVPCTITCLKGLKHGVQTDPIRSVFSPRRVVVVTLVSFWHIAVNIPLRSR